MERDWWVYSTALADRSLLVKDRNSGDLGYVPDPTESEWAEAFHAPSKPYRWPHAERVIVDNGTAPPFSEDVKEAALKMAQERCQGA
jgi:hypothetical protein